LKVPITFLHVTPFHSVLVAVCVCKCMYVHINIRDSPALWAVRACVCMYKVLECRATTRHSVVVAVHVCMCACACVRDKYVCK